MARDNDRFLKQVAFHLLRLAVFRNESIRRRAVLGLQILIRVSSLSIKDTASPCLNLISHGIKYFFVEFSVLLWSYDAAEGNADNHTVRADV